MGIIKIRISMKSLYLIYMPLDGAQVYVKWADVSVATKIANVFKSKILKVM